MKRKPDVQHSLVTRIAELEQRECRFALVRSEATVTLDEFFAGAIEPGTLANKLRELIDREKVA